MGSDRRIIDGGGLRFNEGKTQIDLIPPDVIEGLGKVLTFGADKYDKNNYRRGMKWSNVINSLLRHINAFRAGEDFDKESGLLHLDHAMCNLVFLREFMRIYPQGDDRLHKYLEMPKVGLDIDDVLSDTISYWCEFHGCDIPSWWHDSNFSKEEWIKQEVIEYDWANEGFGDDSIKELLNKGYEKGYNDAVKLLRDMLKVLHDIAEGQYPSTNE